MAVRQFSSFDDLLAMLMEQQKLAKEAKGIPVKLGDYVLRVWDTGNGVIPIFGRLEDPLSWMFKDGKTLESLNPEERAEYEAEARKVEEGKANGYWFGKWYSILVPEGQLGEVHVSNFVMTITEEQFNVAKDAGWAVQVYLPTPAGDA